MALACTRVGSQIRVEAADERIYTIIGKREQLTLNVCSGSSGGLCQELEVHKFRFDCAGKAVEWVKAAAAVARSQPWKATLNHARMTLHYWPNGPGVDRRLPLTLPVGFAPSPPGGLRFSQPDAPDGQGTPVASREAQPRVSSLRFERPPALLAEAQTSEPPLPLPQPTTVVTLRDHELAPASTSPDEFGWSGMAVIGNSTVHEAWWKSLVPSTMPNALLASIGIAALLLSASAVAARRHGAPSLSGDGTATIEPPLPEPACEVAPGEVPPPPPSTRRSASDDNDDTVAELASALLGDPSSPPADPDWSSVDDMRATAESLLAVVRQLVADLVPDGAVRDVLVADLSVIEARLQGQELADALAEGKMELVQSVYAQAVLDLERTRTLSRIEHERALQVVDEQHRFPVTVEEACAFLGVNPRASEAVVKKVVDALRQNWHPDLAGDEADRHDREERIKHINAAWDLIRLRGSSSRTIG